MLQTSISKKVPGVKFAEDNQNNGDKDEKDNQSNKLTNVY
jgi:hypothetical protein